LFTLVDLEARVRRDHPLRAIRRGADEALGSLTVELSRLYSGMGRPSIPPEMLLRAMLLQAFYSIRSEWQLMGRLEFDLLFRWFVGLRIDDPVWNHSSFSKNRDRLLDGEIAAKFLAAVLAQPRVKQLLSSDHFSVDGTLIEAWASMKSFKPKAAEGGDPLDPPASDGRNAEGRLQGPEALERDPPEHYRPRGPALPQGAWHGGQALLHRSHPDGELIEPRADRPRAITLGADKAYDAEDFVNELRSMNVRAHVAQNTSGRRSAIDGRTTRHAGYGVSQRIRKRIEEPFGWTKTVAGQRRTKFRGRDRVGWAFTLAMAAYNLIRLPKLLGAAA
jgi:transposase